MSSEAPQPDDSPTSVRGVSLGKIKDVATCITAVGAATAMIATGIAYIHEYVLSGNYLFWAGFLLAVAPIPTVKQVKLGMDVDHLLDYKNIAYLSILFILAITCTAMLAISISDRKTWPAVMYGLSAIQYAVLHSLFLGYVTLCVIKESVSIRRDNNEFFVSFLNVIEGELLEANDTLILSILDRTIRMRFSSDEDASKTRDELLRLTSELLDSVKKRKSRILSRKKG